MLHPLSVANLISSGYAANERSPHPAYLPSYMHPIYLRQPTSPSALHIPAGFTLRSPSQSTLLLDDTEHAHGRIEINSNAASRPGICGKEGGLIVEPVTPTSDLDPDASPGCAPEQPTDASSRKSDTRIEEISPIHRDIFSPGRHRESGEFPVSSDKIKYSRISPENKVPRDVLPLTSGDRDDDDDDDDDDNDDNNDADDEVEVTNWRVSDKPDMARDGNISSDGFISPVLTNLQADEDDQSVNHSRSSNEKPPHSYIALISMAILSSQGRKLVLSDIYQYIMNEFEYYNNQDRAWRNSIRHNLSLNECFIKAGRADNGKGNFWAIHPACVEDFSKGDYRRRQARRRARGIAGSPGYEALAAAFPAAWAYQRFTASQNPMNFLSLPTNPILPHNLPHLPTFNSRSGLTSTQLSLPTTSPIPNAYPFPLHSRGVGESLDMPARPTPLPAPGVSPDLPAHMKLASDSVRTRRASGLAHLPGVSHSISNLLHRSAPSLRYSPYPLPGGWW